MPSRYAVEYDRSYLHDLERIDPFDIPAIREAILQLAHQAELKTRNRRPLTAPVSWCTEATWQLRVRGYRVLYRVVDGTATILRLRFKGSSTTEEMGP